MTCNAVPGCSNEAFCYWQKDDGTQLGTCFNPKHQRAALIAMGTPVGPEPMPEVEAAPNLAGNDPPEMEKPKPIAAEGVKPKPTRNR